MVIIFIYSSVRMSRLFFLDLDIYTCFVICNGVIFSVPQVLVCVCDGHWVVLSAAVLLLPAAGDGEEARWARERKLLSYFNLVFPTQEMLQV